MNEDKSNIKKRSKIYPKKEFAQKAHINSKSIYDKDPLDFWKKSSEELTWYKKWDKICNGEGYKTKWFLNGKLNACYNCVDRHVENGKKDKVAIYWEAEDGTSIKWTYQKLYEEVNKFADVLKSKNIKKGDKVALYMPMVLESIVAMLACARIGAVHVVIFGGTGSGAIKDRIFHSDAKMVITSDGANRRGKVLSYKDTMDSAIEGLDAIESVIVIKRCNNDITMKKNRDFWYHDLMRDAKDFCPCEEMDSEDMLFILYTSGSTGKPKGIYHSTAGYLVGVHQTTKIVFDLKDSDIYYCTADIGWITGHSYVVYGPLLNGATQLIYEGAINFPDKDRVWKNIEKYKATIFYTAPTAIRTFIKWDLKYIQHCDISSLRVIGTIGEPINPGVWLWYYKHIGNSRCPIVDTWFQTETGALAISPLPGVTPLIPGSVTWALPGFEAKVLDEDGNEVKKGYLALTKTYPSMMRGMYKDEKRLKEIYWSKWGGKYYYSGDGAMIDDEGYITVTGRLDDVMKISGHRIGSAEVESSLVEYPLAAEASVISVPDLIKGEKIIAFVILRENTSKDLEEIKKDLINHVGKSLGSYAKPEQIFLIKELPKTRSGKIMRRILRNLIIKEPVGDITSLENKESVKNIEQIIRG